TDSGAPSDGTPSAQNPAQNTGQISSNGTPECDEALQVLSKAELNNETEEVFLKAALDQQLESQLKELKVPDSDIAKFLNFSLRQELTWVLSWGNTAPQRVPALASGLSRLVQKSQKNLADLRDAVSKVCGKQQTASTPRSNTSPTA